MSDFEIDDGTEDIQWFDLGMGREVAVAEQSGTVYVSGELHPVGAYSALLLAAKDDVPYASRGAVSAYFPVDWIRGACLHDPDRLRILDNLERIARSADSGVRG